MLHHLHWVRLLLHPMNTENVGMNMENAFIEKLRAQVNTPGIVALLSRHHLVRVELSAVC